MTEADQARLLPAVATVAAVPAVTAAVQAVLLPVVATAVPVQAVVKAVKAVWLPVVATTKAESASPAANDAAAVPVQAVVKAVVAVFRATWSTFVEALPLLPPATPSALFRSGTCVITILT